MELFDVFSRVGFESLESVLDRPLEIVVLDRAGFYANRARIEIRRICELFDQMVEWLQSGAVQTKRDVVIHLNRVFGLYSWLQQSVQTTDARTGGQYSLKQLITEGYGFLEKLRPQLTALINAKGTDGQDLVDYVQKARASLQQALSKLGEYLETLRKTFTPSCSNAELSAIIVELCEECICDLNFVVHHPGLPPSLVKEIQQIVLNLAYYDVKVISQSTPDGLLQVTYELLGKQPTLMGPLSDLAKNSSFGILERAIAHSSSLCRLIGMVIDDAWQSVARDAMDRIISVYSNGDGLAELSADAETILAVFDKVKTSEEEGLYKIFTEAISSCKDNHKLLPFAVCSLVRTITTIRGTTFCFGLIDRAVDSLLSLSMDLVDSVMEMVNQAVDIVKAKQQTDAVARVLQLATFLDEAPRPQLGGTDELVSLDRIIAGVGALTGLLKEVDEGDDNLNRLTEEISTALYGLWGCEYEVIMAIKIPLELEAVSLLNVVKLLSRGPEAPAKGTVQLAEKLGQSLDSQLDRLFIYRPITEIFGFVEDLERSVREDLVNSTSAFKYDDVLETIARCHSSLVSELQSLQSQPSEHIGGFVSARTSQWLKLSLKEAESTVHGLSWFIGRPLTLALRGIGCLPELEVKPLKDLINSLWLLARESSTKPALPVSELVQAIDSLEVRLSALAAVPTPVRQPEPLTQPELLKQPEPVKRPKPVQPVGRGLPKLRKPSLKAVKPAAQQSNVVVLERLEHLVSKTAEGNLSSEDVNQAITEIKELDLDETQTEVLNELDRIQSAVGSSSGSGQVVGQLLSQLWSIQGIDMTHILSTSDIEALLDILYAQLIHYRQCTSNLLEEGLRDDSKLRFYTSWIISIVSASVCCCLQSVGIRTNVDVSLLVTCLDVTLHLLMSLGEVMSALNIRRDSNDKKLRKILRQIGNGLDGMVDIVEREVDSEDATQFDRLRKEYLIGLVPVVSAMSRFVWQGANAYTATQFDISLAAAAMKKDLEKLSNPMNLLSRAAVGSTKDDFDRVHGELIVECRDLPQSLSMNFSALLPAIDVVINIARVAKLAAGVADVAGHLVDHIVTGPDAQSAAELGDDYVLPPQPPMVDKDLAYTGYLNSSKKLAAECNILWDLLAKSDLSGRTVVDAYNRIKELADGVAMGSMRLNLVAKTSQFQRQNALHQFEDGVSFVKEAMRLRLMESPDAAEYANEARAQMQKNLERLDALAYEATTASVAPAPEETPQDTGLPAEVRESIRVVQEMTKRLRNISEPNIIQSKSISEHISSNTEVGSYVLEQSKAILDYALTIFARFQNSIDSYQSGDGREQRLVKAAKEVSDSAFLLILCTERLCTSVDNDTLVKELTCAKMIKSACAGLVAEMRMSSDDIAVIKTHADRITVKMEQAFRQRLEEEEAARVKRGSAFVQKLNLQSRLKDARDEFEQQKRILNRSRRRT